MSAGAVHSGRNGFSDPAGFLSRLDPSGRAAAARAGAIEQFVNAELPTRRHEEWKWIEPRIISPDRLALVPAVLRVRQAPPERTGQAAHDQPDYSAVVELTDDSLVASILPEYNEKIRLSVCDDSAVLPGTGYAVSPRDRISLINDVFWTGGFSIVIAKGAMIEKPIKIIERSSVAKARKNIIAAGEAAEATVIHEAERLADSFDELWICLGQSARLNYYGMQRRAPGVIDISRENVVAGKDAVCRWNSLFQGSRLAKLNQNCFLVGDGAGCFLNEAGILREGENIHVITNFVHARPNTMCDVRSNMAARGATSSSFRGQILIEKQANNSDAMLTHKSLLLSGQGSINSIPVLEILAKDVKCKHAASQGKVDDDQLFYLRSRGISEKGAKELIIEGFINGVFSYGCDQAREPFESFISEMNNADETQGS